MAYDVQKKRSDEKIYPLQEMLKRFLIPPLVPVLLLLALSTLVVFDDIQIVDGKPDNAPRNAAGILVLLSPVFYSIFWVLNVLDSRFDRFRSRVAWGGSIGLCCVLSLLLTGVCYRPEVDPSPLPGIGVAILTGFLALLPMSLLRRFALSGRREAPTIRAQDSVPFGKMFPGAGDVPQLKRTAGASYGEGASNQDRTSSAPPDAL